ncbi:sugar-binding transcriptional regulator [Enterococcus xiangfangensis]|uniref:Sugar-binding domain-containing protein n=1 Tax=Enterococcus xiangfangensis TaxID=1296537 RepID=A0ABU3FCR4_9ENTE|nr:sugar-binding domain-containing protein [Enterococcus xiangfangensis]MBM7712323.1 DNA-binding transcriptional regulator LsrR (DeoR family) [Enterococcus xiangfangensis]MDT2760467.1 sugar-binding domain-containing protein [Enterococcus xiangfangensis]
MLDREDLILKVALLYYENEETQSDIAKKLNISRPTVASLLHEAKKNGIVKITIQHNELHLVKLQEKLTEKYDLKNVKIAAKGQKNMKTAAGKLCADLIEPLLKNITKLGIGWGTTLYEYVEQANLLKLNHLKITPLIGGIGLSEVRFHSNHLAFVLSEKYNCDVSYFYAPAIADTVEVKETLLRTELIKEIIDEGKNVEFALLGVSNPIHSSTYKKLKYISKTEAELLKNEHAIGDIGSTIFTADGTPLRKGFSQRLLGIELKDIKKIPRVAIVATGKEKTESVQTLLNMNVITDLIIDEEIAELL